MDIGLSFRLFRAERNIAVKEISESTGLSRVTLNSVKNGNDVKLSTVTTVADFFGVQLSEFIRRGE